MAPLSKNIKADDLIIKDNKKQFVIQLNSALKFSLGEDEKVFLIGEDIADPYGGAFKVTKEFPHHILAKFFLLLSQKIVL